MAEADITLTGLTKKFGEMVAAGAVAVSDDGRPVENSRTRLAICPMSSSVSTSRRSDCPKCSPPVMCTQFY